MPEPIFLANDADPNMKRAILRARKTFRFFWREMTWEYRRIIPALDVSAIKAAFTDEDDLSEAEDVEQMWVSEVSFDGRTLSGTLINQPNELQSVSQGDPVDVKLSELTDWMYAIEGTAYGALTVNHMRSEMGRGERKAHDGAWGLKFGDPKIIQYVPPDYIGEKKGSMLTRLAGSSASQDVKKVSATEHPMAVNMLGSMKEHFSDKDNLTSADEDGLNVLHSMSLGGSAQAVHTLLKLGADPTTKTEHGDTAFRLAKRLGWTNVLRAFAKHGVSG